jgi:hypothetical protein
LGTSLPELPQQRNFEQAFELSFRLARRDLAGLKDLRQLAARAGASTTPEDKKSMLVDYLGLACRIQWPQLHIEPELPPREGLLLLHYLVKCSSAGADDLNTGRTVSYQQLPPGLVYSPVFLKRAVKPLLDRFAGSPGALTRAAAKFGGKKAEYGDESVTLAILPRIAVTLMIWRADPEFPATGNILFDQAISSYMPAEDITVMSEVLAWKLVKAGV